MTLEDGAGSIFPSEVMGAPYDRKPQKDGDLGLPVDTVVVSADSHISLAEDIWYERFPASMKDRAPRVWYDDGGFQFGSKDKPMLPEQFRMALNQFESLPGCQSDHMDERMADLSAEGIDKELVGQVAARVRSTRKPEPYKGKGVRYSTEVIRRKAGKAGKIGGKK